MNEGFEQMLTGGHPNSLGRTVEVFETVLADPSLLPDLFDTYQSDDEVVRLRVSSAIKRLARADPTFLLPILDRLLTETGELDQASAQWTLAQIFPLLRPHMSDTQFNRARSILKRNLEHHSDWIVLCETIKTLTGWASDDEDLRAWMTPHLERHSKDDRKSVSRNAKKALLALH